MLIYRKKVNIIIKTKVTLFKINPLVLAVIPVFAFAGLGLEYFSVFFCMLLHELAHIFLALFFGCRLYSVSILPVGLNVLIGLDDCGKWERTAIYSAGPMLNIIILMSGLIIRSLTFISTEDINFFISINAYLAVFNLLPALPLDGGKILREILAGRVGVFSSNNYLKKTSLFLSVFVIILGLIQVFSYTHNFSLLMMGVYLLFFIKPKEMEAAIMNVKNVVYRRSRLLKKGVYPARDLVVVKSIHLGEVIKSMDFDRFHFFHVLDEDLRLIKVISEQEVIDAMLKYNTDLTFEELIEKSI